MRRALAAVVAASAFSLTGCYHAVVETGRPAGDVVINKPWVNSFVYGLVAPPVQQVADQCRGGVAKVETQHSFLNGLVAGITWGIYTPMTITVTCARANAMAPGARSIDVGAAKSPADAFEQAIQLSDRTDGAVYLKF